MTEHIRVDLLTLEEFGHAIADRMAELEDLHSRFLTGVSSQEPPLGDFIAGSKTARAYDNTHSDIVGTVARLRLAVLATQVATSQILREYRTNEARQSASAGVIADRLSGGEFDADDTGGV